MASQVPSNCEPHSAPINRSSHVFTNTSRKIPAIAATTKLNPFVHVMNVTLYDKIKIAVLSLTIAPVRLVVGLFLLSIAWGFAGIGLSGLTKEELATKPLTGWRRSLRTITSCLVRFFFVVVGFHWVHVKGKQASAKEAPILVIAPHSSFFDALPVVYMGGPSVVAKVEAANAPFFGKLMNFTQPVYVRREDANSRLNTIREMQQRSESKDDWSQISIFPEGTCTNRSCLIAFKAGAFYPGVPVQPVCVKYPNRLDTVTWTWEGAGALQLLWMSVSQFHLHCEIEFLPVYHPSEEERKNPRLFAANVRQKMADAMGVPVADYSYDDCRLMSKAAQKNLPSERGRVEAEGLRTVLGLDLQDVEKEKARYAQIVRSKDGLLTLEDFSAYLNIPSTEPAVRELFSLYDPKGSGKIDFHEYLIGVSLVSKPVNTEDHIRLAFRLFDRKDKGHITRDDLSKILQNALNMTSSESDRLYSQVDSSGKGCITYDEFKRCAEHNPEYARIFTTCRQRWHEAHDQKDNPSENASNQGTPLPLV